MEVRVFLMKSKLLMVEAEIERASGGLNLGIYRI
jgi:hypothetical protein